MILKWVGFIVSTIIPAFCTLICREYIFSILSHLAQALNFPLWNEANISFEILIH